MPEIPPRSVQTKRNASERPGGAAKAHTPNHTAAIHVVKARLGMSDDDYRSLLLALTGKSSSKVMSQGERARVRQRLEHLARLAGLPGRSGKVLRLGAERALERKVWALWRQLWLGGQVQSPHPAALQAWVQRQTGCAHLQACTDAQLHILIESLKGWLARPPAA